MTTLAERITGLKSIWLRKGISQGVARRYRSVQNHDGSRILLDRTTGVTGIYDPNAPKPLFGKRGDSK